MSGPDSKDKDHILYLEEIRIETTTKVHFRVKLQVEGIDIRVGQEEQMLIWTPFRSLEITHASEIMVMVKAGHTIAGIPFGKLDARVETSGQEAMDAFWKSTDLMLNTTFAYQPVTIALKLRPSHSLDTIREYAIRVKEDMKKYKSLMNSSTEQYIETFVKYGAVFGELNPMSKMAFGLIRVTFDLLKEQNKYDDMVSDLAAGIGRILQFAEHTLDDALCDEVELLEPLVKKLFDLTVEIATFVCEYAKRSPTNRIFKSKLSEDRRKVESLRNDFKILIEDLDRAISGATLKATSNIEKDILLKQLNPVNKASYHRNRSCMDGTRTAIIGDIVSWAVKPVLQNTPPTSSNADNVLWIYGLPGIGKTSLANSICHQLHNSKNLGGSFFCRRDDPILSEPERVVPTLIYRLAGMFGPCRTIVAQTLRDDPQLTPESAGGEILLKSLEALKKQPSCALVLVIDALDECGTPDSRFQLLKCLLDACKHVNWLKLIITSRPERDIQSSFEACKAASRDLAEDDQTGQDIRYFAEKRLESLVEKRGLPNGWPGEPRRVKIITRSHGLFIYIETLSRVLGASKDPDALLDQLLDGQLEEDNAELHKLYSTAIASRVGQGANKFQSIARCIASVATYRPLCDETLATLLGEKTYVVKAWVDDLSAILYRDVYQNGGIRFRHLSILEFLTGPSCPSGLRVDMKQGNAELSLYCLTAMMKELKFNICELETSFLANSEVEDLGDRVQRKISDVLQYSCLHWSSHLSFDPSPASDVVSKLTNDFFTGAMPLYWLEVLSVTENVPVAISALRQIKECNEKFGKQVQDRIEDMLRFVLAFSTPISMSTPHIYLSTLPFVPLESTLWQGRTQRWPGRLGVWQGHTNGVKSTACSKNGRHAVSGSYDKTIRIWDAITGIPVGEPWRGHTDSVNSVAYSPDDQYIVSGSNDHTLRIWDATTGAPVGEPLRGHTSSVNSVVYSPNGQYIISGSSDNTIRIWDAITGIPVGEPWRGHTDSVNSIAYSPNGQYIVSGSNDHTIRIWNATTGAPAGEPLRGHIDWVRSVAYSPNGQYVVSGSDDSMIRIWDVTTGTSAGNPLKGHTDWVSSVTFSPNGQYIVSGSYDKTIRIWDVTTGASVGEPLRGHTDSVNSVIFSFSDQHIVSGSDDNTIRIWDARTGAPVGVPLRGHTDSVRSVAYSPNDQNIVSGSADHTIRIWDACTGAPMGEPLRGHVDWVRSVKYSPSGQHIVSGSDDNTIRIWDAITGAPVGEPLRGHTSSVNCVAYSPNGQHFVSGSYDNTIRIWDAVTGAPVGEPLEGHTDSVNSVAYSPSGQYIVSGSNDNTIRIWDATTGAPVGVPLRGHTYSVSSVTYSPSGQHIVSGSFGDMIRIWDASTGTPVVGPLNGHTDSVRSVAYSPSSQFIVSGSNDKTVRVWDATTGAVVGNSLEGHTDSVNSVAYSHNGQSIVSVSRDKTIRIWDARVISKNHGNMLHDIQALYSSLTQAQAFVSTNYSTQPASSGFAIARELVDSNGWVRCNEGLLFWVPEDYRYGLFSSAILAIPTTGRHRCVRVNFDNFRYGSVWTTIRGDV